MYKVIFADDEKNALDEINLVINWRQYGCEIVGTANNGLDAVDLVRKLQPDFLFCDINMPGINGIKVLQEVKKINPDIVFIAVSAYSEFEFLKSCLKYGASDYLLKTVDKDELIALINKHISLIEAKRNSLWDNEKSLLAFNIVSGNDCQKQLNQLGLELKSLIRITISNTQFPYFDSPNFLELQVPFDERRILIESEEQFSLAPHVGGWHEDRSDTVLYSIYRKADIAFCSGKFFANTGKYMPPNSSAVKAVLNNIAEGYNSVLAMLYSRLKSIEELLLLYKKCNENEYDESFSYLDIYHDYDNLSDFAQDICNADFASDNKNSINDIVSYINENFDKALSLNELAKRFYFSVRNLNFVFKQKTGSSVNKYINSLRMEKAMALITDTNLPLVKISKIVGYNDFYYFSRLFKKLHGTAPSNFRKESNS